MPILVAALGGVLVLGVAYLVWRRLQASEVKAALASEEAHISHTSAALLAGNPLLHDILVATRPETVRLAPGDVAAAIATADRILADARPSAAALREAAGLLGECAAHEPGNPEVQLLLAEAAVKACRKESGWDTEWADHGEFLLDRAKRAGAGAAELAGLEALFRLAKGDEGAAKRAIFGAGAHWRVSVARAELATQAGNAKEAAEQWAEATRLAPATRASAMGSGQPLSANLSPSAQKGKFTVELDVLDGLLGDTAQSIIVVDPAGEDEDLLRDCAAQLAGLHWEFADDRGEITIRLADREEVVPVSAVPHERWRVVQAVGRLAAPAFDLRVVKKSLEREHQLLLLAPPDYWDGDGRVVASRFKPVSAVTGV